MTHFLNCLHVRDSVDPCFRALMAVGPAMLVADALFLAGLILVVLDAGEIMGLSGLFQLLARITAVLGVVAIRTVSDRPGIGDRRRAGHRQDAYVQASPQHVGAVAHPIGLFNGESGCFQRNVSGTKRAARQRNRRWPHRPMTGGGHSANPGS